MANFRKALQALGAGELHELRLAESIDELLSRRPELGADMLRQLDEALEAGVVSHAQYFAIRGCVTSLSYPPAQRDGDAPRADRAAPPATAPDDREQGRASESEAPNYAHVGASANSDVDASERTQFDPASAPASSTDSAISINLDASDAPSGSRSGGYERPGSNANGGLAEGDTLRGRYELEQMVGHGGMGNVFKALDLYAVEAEARNPYVAVKILNEDFRRHPKAFIAAHREADRQQKQLAHPNIVKVLAFDRDGENVYMVMELLEGKPLNEFIRDRRKSHVGGLTFDKAWPIIEALGEALQFAHQRGFVHSDFKPANCFLCGDGAAKVLDFGIATAVGSSATKAGDGDGASASPPSAIVIGRDGAGDETRWDAQELRALTVPYASVEMIEGAKPHPADDLYALALVAYELLTLQHPFDRKGADQARKDGLVPQPVAGLRPTQMRALARGLAFSRAERPPDIRTFLADFEGRVPHWKNPRIVLPLAALMLGVPGFFLGQHYLHERANAQLSSRVEAQQVADVDALLTTIFGLEEDERRGFVDNHLPAIEQHAKAHIAAMFGDDEFDAAETFIERVAGLRQSWGLVAEFKTELKQRRAERVNQLDAAIDACLADSSCFVSDGVGSYPGMLATLRKINPSHAKLNDQLVATNFADAVRILLEEEQISQATQVLAGGLALIPADPQLTALQADINARESAAAVERENERLAAELEKLAQTTATRDQLLTALAHATDLQQRQPTHPTLERAAVKLAPLARTELGVLAKAQDWTALVDLRERLAPLAEAWKLVDDLATAASAALDFEARTAALRQGLQNAIAAGRLLPPDRLDGALSAFEELARHLGEGSQLEELRELLLSSFIAEARRAARDNTFELARNLVDEASRIGGTEATGRALERLSKDIELAATARESADKEAIKAERLARAASSFEEQLRDLPPTQAAMTSALSLIDDIKALAPDHKLVTAGPARLKNSIADLASRALENGDIEAGLAMLDAARAARVAESSRLKKVRQALESQRQAGLIAAEAANVARSKAIVDELLQKPRFDERWRKRLGDALQTTKAAVAAEDAWTAAIDGRVRQTYFDEILRRLTGKNFDGARELMIALDGVPASAAQIKTLDARITSEESEWKANREALELEERKTRLRNLIAANKFEDARSVFSGLTKQLAADDGFVAEINNQFAEAYRARAENLAEHEPDKALAFTGEGLKYAPNSRPLSELAEKLYKRSHDRALEEIANLDSRNATRIGATLNALRQARPQSRSALDAEFAAAVNARIAAWPAAEATTCAAYLESAGTLFVDVRIESCPRSETVAVEPTWLAEVNRNIDAGQLTAAGKALNAVDSIGQSLPAYSEVLKKLELRRQLAMATEAQAKSADERGDRAAAEVALADAKRIWTDWGKWLAINVPSVTPRPAAANGSKACIAKFAGKGRSARAHCFDAVGNGEMGPKLAVIPTGEGVPPFAIGVYEVSIGDYNTYCKLSGACAALDGDASMPLTGVALDSVRQYLAWLSAATGQKYRLPTNAEWVYAARAGSPTSDRNVNCRVVVGGAIVKGGGPLSVRSGASNPWGLYNVVGNVQEWVEDGSVRGGAFEDDIERCVPDLEESNDGSGDHATGFRPVRELG